ncbi:MAG: hypothetical protein ACYDAG_07580 [Chloroflexota bacterium]
MALSVTFDPRLPIRDLRAVSSVLGQSTAADPAEPIEDLRSQVVVAVDDGGSHAK